MTIDLALVTTRVVEHKLHMDLHVKDQVEVGRPYQVPRSTLLRLDHTSHIPPDRWGSPADPLVEVDNRSVGDAGMGLKVRATFDPCVVLTADSKVNARLSGI